MSNEVKYDDLVEVKVDQYVDLATGSRTTVMAGEDPNKINEEDLYKFTSDTDKIIASEYDKVAENVITEKEDIYAGITKAFVGDIDDESLKVAYDIIIRLEKGEKFSVYNQLTPKLKIYFDRLAGPVNKELKRSMTTAFFKEIINDIRDDKAIDAIGEYKNKSVKNILEEHRKDVYENYFEKQKEVMVDPYLGLSEELTTIDIEDAAEKSKVAKNIAEMYQDSYNLTGFKEWVNNNLGRVKYNDIIYKKADRELDMFNDKYRENTKFNMINIKTVIPVLLRYIPGSNEYDIYGLLLAFIKYSDVLERRVGELIAYVFKFYFVSNIVVCNEIYTESDIKFREDFFNNITDIIETIRNVNKKEG